MNSNRLNGEDGVTLDGRWGVCWTGITQRSEVVPPGFYLLDFIENYLLLELEVSGPLEWSTRVAVSRFPAIEVDSPGLAQPAMFLPAVAGNIVLNY
jgi:hypothetical protein